MSIKKLSEVSAQSKLHLINYGPSGGGKTIKSCQARRWGPVYIADFDGKAEGLAMWFKVNDPKALDLISVETFLDGAEGPTAAANFFLRLDEFVKQAKEGTLPYATIVLDTFTTFQDAFLKHLVAMNGKDSRAKMTHVVTKEFHVTFPNLEDYRVHKSAQIEFLMRMMRLPVNIIINFHDDVKQDEITSAIERGILASGALAKVIPAFFNECHRVIKRNGAWVSQVQHDGTYPANTKLTTKEIYIPSDLSVFDGIALKRE